MSIAPLTHEPNLHSMLAHLVWLASPARLSKPKLRIEIAWGEPDSGPTNARTFGIEKLSDATGFAAWINRKGCNVYVGSTLKSADVPFKGRTQAVDAALAICLPVDSDVHLVETAERLATLAIPQLLVFTGRLPELRGQLFARVRPTTDLESWELVQAHAVQLCGGDENALGRNRLMRLAGTVSYPSSSKVARGYTVEQTSGHYIPAPEYSVPNLLAAMSVSAPRTPVAGMAQVQSALPARRPKPPQAAVEAALRNLPSEFVEMHRLWIKVGFALYDFDSGTLGLDLWQRFSQRCVDKANKTDFAKLWQGFGRPYTGHRITVAWLLHSSRRPSRGV